MDQNDRDVQAGNQLHELVDICQDKQRLAALFDQSRDRLKRIVCSSIDRRVQARVDASDVLQDTFVEAAARIDEYIAAPTVSLFVWLRFLAKQQLAKLHRHHLGVQARDARRDVSIDRTSHGCESAVALAALVAGRLTTASSAVQRKEATLEVQEALRHLDAKSREILHLRHFEQLGNNEAAEVLEITATAACNRYIRALERLRRVLTGASTR